MFEHIHKYYTYYLKAVFGLSFALLIFTSIWFFKAKRELKSNAVEFGEKMIGQSVIHIDSVLDSIDADAKILAKKLSQRRYTATELEHEIKQLALSQSTILGVTVAYTPYAFSKDKKLHAPFFNKKEHRIIYTETLYDYTDTSKPLNSTWFYSPILKRGPVWCEPGYGPASQAVVAEFGVPFYQPGNPTEIIGIVDITFSLEGFSTLLNSLNLGKNGFAILVSSQGNILSHPRKDFIKSLMNISELASDVKEGGYQEISKLMMSKNEGYVEHYDPLLDRESLFFFKHINSTHWYLGISIVKEELFMRSKSFYRLKVSLATSAVVFTMLSILLLFGFHKLEKIWVGVEVTAIGFLIGIGIVWFLHHHKPLFYDTTDDLLIISDQNSLHVFESKNDLNAIKMHEKPPVYIPTGIYIRNIEFKEGRQVGINGTIWQKYDLQLNKGIARGFFFPDLSTDAEAYTLDTAYNLVEHGHQLIGWNFRLNLLNNVDYKLYPFDRKNLKVNIRHITLGQNVYLIPDQEGYESFLPSSLPGVNKKIPVTGWIFKGSYYSYDFKSFHTNFGMTNFQRERNIPELSFNIVLIRKIVGPLIAHIIPLVIVLIMLFGVIIIFSKKNIEATGYNSFGVINSCAAFFFVIVVSHIDLRNTLEVEMVTYMEYIYFIVYLYILLVTINSILFSSEKHIAFVDYMDNYIPKLLFWPLFLFSTFTLTLIMFF